MAMAAHMRTTTGTRPMRTPIDASLLTLTQWLSPAFPTGAFAYSHGVEMAIHEGWIKDATTLTAWLSDCLTDGTGRSDVIWLRLAYACENPSDIDTKARAYAISRERLREADRQGVAFVGTVNAVWGYHLPNLLLPVAVGRAARLANVDVDATVSIYLQAFVTNLTSAALRLCPIGQTAGQRVISDLQDICITVAEDTRDSGAGDIYGNTFLSDISAMTHETLEPRLFQS